MKEGIERCRQVELYTHVQETTSQSNATSTISIIIMIFCLSCDAVSHRDMRVSNVLSPSKLRVRVCTVVPLTHVRYHLPTYLGSWMFVRICTCTYLE